MEYRTKIKLLQIFGTLDLPSPASTPEQSAEKGKGAASNPDPPEGEETSEWIRNYYPTDPLGLKRSK